VYWEDKRTKFNTKFPVCANIPGIQNTYYLRISCKVLTLNLEKYSKDAAQEHPIEDPLYFMGPLSAAGQ
jgi:hypothetical protein